MADKMPWSKFFWNDWQGDPCLRVCSLAAQGLWMRMLCLAAESDPTGYVTIAGRAVTSTDLARLTGETEQAVQSLLAELDRNGVFSRDRKGTIYSRRMVRENKKAAIARKNGKNGGNPSLCSERVIPASDNPQDKGGDNTQKPEARSQNPESDLWKGMEDEIWAIAKQSPDAKRVAGWIDDFRIVTEWRKAGYRPTEVLDAAKTVLARTPEVRSLWGLLRTAVPAEIAKTREVAAQPSPADAETERWRGRVAGLRRSGLWLDIWGPQPGRPGCEVPGSVMAELETELEAM